MARLFQRTFARSLLVAGSVLLLVGTSFAQQGAKVPVAPTGKKLPTKKEKAPAKPERLPLADSLTGEAKKIYVGAKILYETGDFANALAQFRKAYELSQEPRLLKNVAICEKDLRHYSRALGLLDEYRAKAGEAITPEEEESLKALEDALRTLTGTVTFVISEADATVLLDGETIGTSPMIKPIRIDMGERKITARKAGFKPFDVKQTIDGDSTLTVVAKLERDWQRGRIVIEAGPRDLLAIDGKMVGLGRYEGYVKAGGHSLRVSAPGMAVYQNEVVVRDGETRRVQITLNPLPVKQDMSKWLWIGGGALLAAGALVGGALMFKPTEVPPIDGTAGTVTLSFGGLQ